MAALESGDLKTDQSGKTPISPTNAADKAQIIVGMVRLSAPERQKLINAGVESAEHFWAYIGRDSSTGISVLAGTAGIDQNRLIEIAASQALYESESRKTSWAQRLWTTLEDHWLDVLLIAATCFIFVLFSRAAGLLDRLPGPIGLHSRVIVSTSDLQKGALLQRESLSSARSVPRLNHFSEFDQLNGLLAAQDIKAGNPIRFEQVLRLQLVATKDIPLGARITNDAITLAWSLYEPDATTNAEQLLEHTTTRTFKPGDAIPIRSICK